MHLLQRIVTLYLQVLNPNFADELNWNHNRKRPRFIQTGAFLKSTEVEIYFIEIALPSVAFTVFQAASIFFTVSSGSGT